VLPTRTGPEDTTLMSTTCLTFPSAPPRSSYAAVRLRPLEPGDSATVMEVFAGLGARSRHRRFLTAKPRLTSADLRQLSAVDDRDHVAVVAVSVLHGRPVGVGRFVRDRHDPHSADVALAVVDAWQCLGVGTALAEALVRRARGAGVRRFTLATASDNHAVLRLLHRAPGAVERLADDETVTEFAVALGEPAPTARRHDTGVVR
jgi:acetyltransferase